MLKIFVISLPNEKKRQDYIQSVFDAKGVPFEFLTGIDGRKLNQEEINIYYDAERAKKYDGELSKGEIGCALSHRIAYEQIIENNIEHSIVLEDDVKLNNDFFSILNLLEKVSINKYVIKLDKFYSKQLDDDNRRHSYFTPWHKIMLNKEYIIGQPLYDPTLAWGYYIDIKAARVLYNLMPKIFVVADAWYYFRRFIKLRMINKTLVDNNERFESIIGTHVEQFSKKKSSNHHDAKTNIEKNIQRFFKKIIKAVRLILIIFK
jgi:glycosyl transferase family 25